MKLLKLPDDVDPFTERIETLKTAFVAPEGLKYMDQVIDAMLETMAEVPRSESMSLSNAEHYLVICRHWLWECIVEAEIADGDEEEG